MKQWSKSSEHSTAIPIKGLVATRTGEQTWHRQNYVSLTQRFSATQPEPARLPGVRSPLSLQHLFSSSIYAAQPLLLFQAEMWCTPLLLFLVRKQSVVGNKKNKYSCKPRPVAVSLRRCPANMDTRGGGTCTYLVQPQTPLLQMAPLPTWHIPGGHACSQQSSRPSSAFSAHISHWQHLFPVPASHQGILLQCRGQSETKICQGQWLCNCLEPLQAGQF